MEVKVIEETASKEDELIKDDVISDTEESDEEEEDQVDDSGGYGHAVKAFQYGDAHGPKIVTDKEKTHDSADVRVPEDVHAEDSEMKVQVDAVADDSVIETGTEVARGESVTHFHTGLDTVTPDSAEEIVSKTDEHLEDNVDTSIDTVEIKSKISAEDKEADVEEHVAEGGDEDTVRKKPVPPPRPTRRSTRPRKPPERYNDYVMYQMSNAPVDRKLRAMQSLMDSGILNAVDSDMAHSLIKAVMK